MKKKILKLFLGLIVFLCVTGTTFLVYHFKEIKATDEMFRPEGKIFGYGLIEFYRFNNVLSAVLEEDQQKVEYFIDKKNYSLNLFGAKGNLLVYYLAGKGAQANLSFIRFLLIKGVDANGEKDYSTALSLALIHKRNDIVEELVKFGADVNRPSFRGDVPILPLDIALRLEDCEVAKFLKNHGAELADDALIKKLENCYQ